MGMRRWVPRVISVRIRILVARMRRIPLADYGGQRQIRQEEFTPTPPNRIVSDEQMQYLTQVPEQQRKYAANTTYNGVAAKQLGSTP
jgi:hypothetical protein